MSKMVIEGVLSFADLWQPGGSPKFPGQEKYSVSLLVAKGSPSEAAIFNAMDKCATDVWGAEGPQKLVNIHAECQTGRGLGNSLVSLRDGDQFQPEYNGGFWFIKASRRQNQDRPHVGTIIGSVPGPDGTPTFAECPSPDTPGAPKPGYGVRCLVDVWGQQAQERINFTLVSCVAIQRGVKRGGNPAADQKAIEAFTQSVLSSPVLAIPGVTQAAQQPVAAVPAQAAPTTAPVAPEPAQAPSAPVAGPPVETLVEPEGETGGEGNLIEL